jgi:outer membrane protein TolC
MSTDRRAGVSLACVGVAVLTWTVPAPALAQLPPPSSARDQSPAQTAARPRVFPKTGITLESAVRLALELNPDIALARAEVERAHGLALEQQGLFDNRVWGTLFYEYRQQELAQSVKDQEQERRTDLSDALATARRDYDRLQELARLLRVVRAAPPGAQQVNAIGAISPDVASQIRALDVLIAAQGSASVRAQLRGIRDEFIDRTIADASQGAAEAIDGYQEGEESLRRLGVTPVDEVLYNAGFELNFSRRIRAGLNFTPFFYGQAEGDNYKGKLTGEDDGGKGLEDLYTFRTGLATEVPLGRGRGAAATAAFERAAARESEAARFDLQFRLSEVVNDTVLRYWELRAAMESRDAIVAQVERQSRLVELTRAAIDAGEQPQVELARVQASEARAGARLRNAERALIDARVALATVLGVAADERDETLPLAADAFPSLPPAEPIDAHTAAALGSAAAAARADYQAAEQRQRAGEALEAGASADTRPRLDLRHSIWYTALAERSAGDALDRWVGPSNDIQLEFEQPFGNNQAGGRHAQRQAEARQRQIDTSRSAREIALNVLGVAESVSLARARVTHAQGAVTAYEQTGVGEVERFRAGEATLIDVILTEAEQTDAQLALVTARQDLASLIAQLRFESGTLIRVDAQLQPRLVPSDLVSIPRSLPKR